MELCTNCDFHTDRDIFFSSHMGRLISREKYQIIQGERMAKFFTFVGMD